MYADGEMAWTSKDLPKNLRIWTHQWCGAFKDSERGAVKYHPTQKPIALYKWLLDKYAKCSKCSVSEKVALNTINYDIQICKKCNGNIPKILDTHLGSGSIAIACHDYGFDLTACELDKEYFDKAMERIKNHTNQQKLF
jgi:site-specific DNA-methyltransferase (adenine-specific)